MEIYLTKNEKGKYFAFSVMPTENIAYGNTPEEAWRSLYNHLKNGGWSMQQDVKPEPTLDTTSDVQKMNVSFTL